MNILDKIIEKRKEDLAACKERVSLERVKMQAEQLAREELKQECCFTYPFLKSLSGEGIHFICEVKKASPSKGMLVRDFPYLSIAREYERAGAAAISVLTEPHFFLGKDQYLKEIAAQVSIPVLRKDFVVDAYQIYEAKLLGASAILLICALLEDKKLKEFLKTSHELGLSVLVEAHDEKEVEQAVGAGAEIIGVNNRDLRTFHVTIENSVRLRKLIPNNILFVSESGIETKEDIHRLKVNGANGVLIGEAFMKSKNKEQMLKKLAGESI